MAFRRRNRDPVEPFRRVLRRFTEHLPDVEATVNAQTEAGSTIGLGWVVFRYLLWTSGDTTVELPATYLTAIGHRVAPDGATEFRFTWTDHGDDRLNPDIPLPPHNPWHIAVMDEAFLDRVSGFNVYLPRPGRPPFMKGARELSGRRGTEVATWLSCPLCLGPLSTTAHGSWCSSCSRVFTDPGLIPVVKRDSPRTFGQPVGAELLPPLHIDIDQGIDVLPQVWMVKPLDDTSTAPDVVKDMLVLWAAADVIPGPGATPQPQPLRVMSCSKGVLAGSAPCRKVPSTRGSAIPTCQLLPAHSAL